MPLSDGAAHLTRSWWPEGTVPSAKPSPAPPGCRSPRSSDTSPWAPPTTFPKTWTCPWTSSRSWPPPRSPVCPTPMTWAVQREKLPLRGRLWGLYGDRLLHPQKAKNLLGYNAYILEVVKNLASIKPYHIKVEWEDQVLEGDYLYGMVSNTTSVGRFLLSPGNPDLSDAFWRSPSSPPSGMSKTWRSSAGRCS